ncbi:MAG: hypothetical protein WA085_17795, partial [Sphingobium sp.]
MIAMLSAYPGFQLHCLANGMVAQTAIRQQKRFTLTRREDRNSSGRQRQPQTLRCLVLHPHDALQRLALWFIRPRVDIGCIINREGYGR